MTVLAELGAEPRMPSESPYPVAISNELFAECPEAAFYVGEIAAGKDNIYIPELYEAAMQLRGRVYVDELGILPPDARDARGGEKDADDDRAIHFVVAENRGPEKDARVIACSRLIVRQSVHQSLPVERYFPEVFEDRPIESRAVEASRYISRHEISITQSLAAMALIRAMVSWCIVHGRRPVYAILEGHLAEQFKKTHLLLTELSDYKPVEDYGNTENAAVRFEPNAIVAEYQKREEELAREARIDGASIQPSPMRRFYSDAILHKGVGYFDRRLLTIVG